MPIALGGLSAVLYSTVFLSPLFLVPVQASGARKGFRSMLISASASGLGACAIQLLFALRAGTVEPGMLLAGMVAPLAMLIALLLVAAPKFRHIDVSLRTMFATVVAAAITLPSLIAAGKSPQLRVLFNEAAGSATEILGTEAVNADVLWQTMSGAVLASFGAVIFVLVFLSLWLGSRYALTGILPVQNSKPVLPSDSAPAGTEAASETHAAATELRLVRIQAHPDPVSLPPPLAMFRVSQSLVWGLLASWAAILAGRFVHLGALTAVAWNLAITFSVVYAFQGLAVALALAERKGMAPAVRAFGPIVLVLLIASGTVGLVAVGLFALLGTLETWIPFRTIPKGEEP